MVAGSVTGLLFFNPGFLVLYRTSDFYLLIKFLFSFFWESLGGIVLTSAKMTCSIGTVREGIPV